MNTRILNFWLCCATFSMLSLYGAHATHAQEQPESKPAAQQEANEDKTSYPIVRFIRLMSPVDERLFRLVRNTATKMQEEASNEQREAYLFLEIPAGQSEFYQVHGLAKFLTSAEIQDVRTIAWVPETVTGNNVVIALGCNEIVMHPDAQLGDIGRGKPVDADEEQLVLSLTEKRHNLQVSRALTLGMLNPQATILQATLEKDDGVTEKRVTTEEELKRLRENRINIIDVVTIKDRGQPGLLSGTRARELGVLASKLAESQSELAEIYGLNPQDLREEINDDDALQVRVIEVMGPIDPLLGSFVKRQIDRAVAEDANVIIFKIDSPGGSLDVALYLAETIADLEDQNIRTAAYIPDNAISGAAIIAMGCDDIFMEDNGKIGDAGVLLENDDGKYEYVPEKKISYLRPTFRALAEKKNRPPALFEAMSFKDMKIYKVTHRDTGRTWYLSDEEIFKSNGEWIQGDQVKETDGLFLTVQADRAVELKLATAVVSDFEDLRTWLNIPPEANLAEVERTWVDDLIALLNDPFITGFLLFLAMICIYIELHFMIGIFGIASALFFGIFFWSHYLGGTATSLEIMLFFLGVVCILMEVFVIPGFGVFGVSGGLMIVASLILASETFSSFDPDFNTRQVMRGLTTLGLPMIAVIISSILIGKYLPSIPILRHVILVPPTSQHAGDTEAMQLRPDLAGDVDSHDNLVGEKGVAISMLRPAGKAQIKGRYIDVVSEGGFIQPQQSIEVTEVHGNRIVVRTVDT